MADALKNLPQSRHPSLLVGFNKADDAGVYLLNERQALVQTIDFFPPIVDDPFTFGQIAAANALSDVFAMGGQPLTVLNMIGFPVGKMPPSIFIDILHGSGEKVEEAGAVVVGGHSIKDQELKFGLAVTGLVNPEQMVTNAGAHPGNVLILTKPLGTGIITTGIKRGKVSLELTELVTRQMATLNKVPSELMVLHRCHAATDITGYGLLGHAYEMAAASEVTIKFFSECMPLLEGALQLAADGMIPGGANDNRAYLADKVKTADNIEKNLLKVLYDPQTSGGLLIAINPDRAEHFERDMAARNLPCWRIGEISDKTEYPIVVE